jgi:molybdopterin biosynthesis enzyme
MNAQRITKLTPVDAVLARVAALARPVAPYEIATEDAPGCVLAEDIASAAALPAAAIALRDGWAVRAEQVADAGPYAPMPLGQAPAWVDAGNSLPADSDAMLPPDAITGKEAHASATAGDGVLAAGADMAAGQILRRAGERLRGTDIAVLLAAGIKSVQVREPLVRIIHVRSEGTARAVARGVARHGANLMVLEGLEKAFEADCDAIIAIGGTGEGRHDESVSLLAKHGQVDIHGFGLSPGETAALGSAAGKPVLLLPARLDGALAAFLVVGGPLLRTLTGTTTSEPGMPVTLMRKIVSTVGMAEVVPVRRANGGAEPLASGHWPLATIARADGWVFVPPQSEGFAAGAELEMRAFP